MSHEHTKLRYNRIPFHMDAGENILCAVEKHWEKMREMGTIPAQMSLSPEPLDNVLSNCFVVERVGDTIARFRVAGQALTALMGMEARAMPLSALFTVEGRRALGPLIKAACEGPEIIEIPVQSTRGLGRTALRGRVLLLPLKDRNGKIERIFGCIVTDVAPGRRALRFDIDTSIPLRCKRLAPTTETMAAVRDRITAQCNDLVSIPDTNPRNAQAHVPHPHLRLVVNNV